MAAVTRLDGNSLAQIQILPDKKAYSTLETVIAKIALTTMPPQIRAILPELTIETNEEPFLEDKYQLRSSRTFRTLFVRFSEHSEKILSNERLMGILQKIERTGFSVPTEKLVGLKEDQEAEWVACHEGVRIKLLVHPNQRQLYTSMPKLLQNVPFEVAFANSVADAKK